MSIVSPSSTIFPGAPAASVGFRPGRVLGWAVYLATSWTWCIGMYLPALFLRDFGWAGFALFSIPNVLGAAAMGWVVRSDEESHRFVHNHRAACLAFSLVTIIFHAFFVGWVVRRLLGPVSGQAVIAAFIVLIWLMQWRRGGSFLASGLALGVSAAALCFGLHSGDLPHVVAYAGRLSRINLLWISPVLIFGFALSPYLDLTFHAARQSLHPSEARAAFPLAFLVIFPAVLLFTALYSGWIALPAAQLHSVPNPFVYLLGAHLVVQSCFTCAAHLDQISQRVRRLHVERFLAFGVALILAVEIGLGVQVTTRFTRHMTVGEAIYRTLIGCYGLIFPAYVWLRAIPPVRSNGRLAVTLLLALPLYGEAFFFDRYWCLIPAAGILLMAKLGFTAGVAASGETRRPRPPAK